MKILWIEDFGSGFGLDTNPEQLMVALFEGSLFKDSLKI